MVWQEVERGSKAGICWLIAHSFQNCDVLRSRWQKQSLSSGSEVLEDLDGRHFDPQQIKRLALREKTAEVRFGHRFWIPVHGPVCQNATPRFGSSEAIDDNAMEQWPY